MIMLKINKNEKKTHNTKKAHRQTKKKGSINKNQNHQILEEKKV